MPKSKKIKKYTDPDNRDEITAEQLGKLKKSEQIEVMRRWFHQHYADPVEECPHDEGEYVWIFGGPFDAHEELEAEFDGIVDEKTIGKLGDELSAECWEWSGQATPEFYDDSYEVEIALDEKIPLDAMEIKLKKLEALLDQKPFQAAELQDFQGIMIFSFAITTLETYLATVFIKNVMSDEKFKIEYMKTEEALSKQKFPLTEAIKTYKDLDGTLKSQLAQTTFHNMGNAAKLFKGVFGVEFGDVDRLKELVNKRHNFVHHAGQDPIKGKATTTVNEIDEVIKLVRKFCKHIDEQMKKS